ncbi:MAG: triose-phosphate isomerase [Pseudomonadales bacterium]|nr:triose-phosphate isomerase [Pseudomonadales bacterium]
MSWWKMRRSLIAGNWKMNGSRQTAQSLLHDLVNGLGRGRNDLDIVVCPPSVFLPMTEKMLAGSELVTGAQNVYCESSGAFTGELSAGMLAEFSVRYVIVGHSERRSLFGETDALIAAKFRALQLAAMIPILCVGETWEQRRQGLAEEIVGDQIRVVIDGLTEAELATAVIAYEPVWAIGTGQTATPVQAQQMHEFIRAVLAAKNPQAADCTRLLYGGSVNADNAAELFAQPDIDGGLVGGASLQAEEYIRICDSVS